MTTSRLRADVAWRPLIGVDERTRRLVGAAAGIAAAEETIFDALDDYLGELTAEERQADLDRVWLEAAITHTEARDAYPDLSDDFDILQGDVIRTEAAFILGVRQSGAFVVGSATCDTVVRPRPRRGSILLLPVVERRLADFTGKTDEARLRERDAMLERLVSFQTRKALYLPRLPDDPPDVLFNTISFQHLAVLDTDVIPTVRRIASMSLVGWRAFNVLLQTLIARTGDEEAGFRLAVAERRAA